MRAGNDQRPSLFADVRAAKGQGCQTPTVCGASDTPLMHAGNDHRPWFCAVTCELRMNGMRGTVTKEWMSESNTSVMLAGYAVYQGHMVFRALANRIEQMPELRVTMFLDMRRPDGDATSEAEVVRRFAARFKEKDWPGNRYLSFVNRIEGRSDPPLGQQHHRFSHCRTPGDRSFRRWADRDHVVRCLRK